MRKIISAVLIAATLVSCTASCKPAGSSDETQSEEYTTSYEPDIKKPKNPDKTLFQKTQEEYEGGNLGCTGLTLLAKYNKGVAYNINSYKDEENKIYYLFVPCRADVGSITFTVTHRDGSESGPYTANFSDDRVSENEKVISTTNEYTIKVMQSNLPSIMIEIDESYGTVDAMHADEAHETFAYGDMVATVTDYMALNTGWKTRYESVDKKADSYCSMKMRGRGNSTWGYSKKPYQISLENSIDLFGMGKSKKYVLLANDRDSSRIRTQLALGMGISSGIPYTSEHRQVDLFLNGEYLGMYLIAEKIEVGENRVEIDQAEDVLYEKDNFATLEKSFTFQTEHVHDMERGFRVHSPEIEEAMPEYIEKVQIAETVLYGSNDEMFEKFFDLDSWARMYLLQLYTMNSDAYYGSFYFYYDNTDGKMYACAPWDFDWSMGVSWGNSDFYVNPMSYDIDHIEWIKPMLTHENFIKKVLEVYYEGGVKEIIEGMPGLVDEYAKENRKSALMDAIVNDVFYYPEDVTEYDDIIAYVKGVCENRVVFVEQKMESYAAKYGYVVN